MARQKAGLYSSIENDVIISIFINNYNKARIFFLLNRYKETIIFSLYINKSIFY